MMMKNFLFAAALLSLALASGCAKGGSGPPPPIEVSINTPKVAVLYVTQQLTFTATVTNTSNQAVTWSLSGTACTPMGNPCGTIGATTGAYTAPATAPNPNAVTITATSQADPTATGTLVIHVNQITVNITPGSPNVGVGLTQQFTAVAIPDDAPQNFTWSIQNCLGGGCGSFDPNTPGLYSAVGATTGATFSAQAAVPASLDPTGFNSTNVTVVNSRLGGKTTYAFRFSGFDVAGNATALVGNFAVAVDGVTITSGVEDVLTASGGFAEYTTVTGTYTPNPPSNNQGTITLQASGAPGSIPNTFTAVLDASGDIQMIESDSNGTGSGVIEPVTPSRFKDDTSLSGAFVFGLTGTDYLTTKRVGYAGVLQMDGNGNILAPGGTPPPTVMDINDGGTASSASDVSGSYSMANGIGTMTLTSATLGKTYEFNLYGVSGQLSGSNPLTLYAVSTDGLGVNPAVSGTVVFQDPKPNKQTSYNNAALNGTSIAGLTGADRSGTNVSLTLLTTDGSGNLSGNFDQNDAGTILSVKSFSTGYKYSATGNGRYTVQFLGNPNSTPAVPPLTFALYASGNGRGFLLDIDPSDKSTASVITGPMTPQGRAPNFGFGPSELPGTFAAATTSSGASGVMPIAANLLFTWANPTQGVAGTQYVGTGAPASLSGTYSMFLAYSPQGAATIALTAPSAQNYVSYFIDTSGCAGQQAFCTVLDFLMIDVDKTNTAPSVIFARQ